MSVLEQLSAGVALSQLNAALVTAIAWDILIYFEEEVDLAVRYGFSSSSIVYFASRIGILFWCILSLIMEKVPFSHCEVVWGITAIITVVAGSATALLFVIRVCAVYEQSKAVKIFFTIFWLATPVSGILTSIYGRSSHMGSPMCSISGVQYFVSICLWITAAFDTSVFLAITWRIISYSTACKISLWQTFRGAGQPRICRELLQGGQLFYFVTVGVTLVGACAMFIPVNPIYRLSFTQPSLALQSIMACRVHRRIFLGSNRLKVDHDSAHNIAMTTILPYFPHPELSRNIELDL
ncbi:hypothetical protein FIBSPDRAFT_935096 [Athelia psychrophila]|uniref:DUF6533 domain-containing protein n=1 Tax=Athelia psychrophila TaxID=1759441 RepID=A0A166E8N4_9AGAM|nr:hypothetical protein FIBSPDRAFT_935096 [Fibularhizoctonia sp. CBS 109695]